MTAVLPPPIHSVSAAAPAAGMAYHTMMGLPQDYNFAFVAKVPRPSMTAPGAPQARLGSFTQGSSDASLAANPYAYSGRPLQQAPTRSPRRGSFLDGASFAPLALQGGAELSSAQGRTSMQHPVQPVQPQQQPQASAYFDSSQMLERDASHVRHAPPPSTQSSRQQSQQQQMWHAHAHATQDGIIPQTPPEQSHQEATHTTPASSTRSHSRPSTDRIANFFASMTCYIWFATGLPDTSPLNTPLHSPSTTHAPLFPTPLAAGRRRSHRELNAPNPPSTATSVHTGVAGPLSLLPTDDFADRLSLAMERVSMATGGSTDGAPQGLYARPLGSLRMQPSARFVAFIKNLLTTTQVSSSVILLALLYIYRLKSRHPQLNGQEGSEYRLSVTSLMLANKWLDDHTYLNKTWSELSGIELRDVTKMEREFWSGLGMDIAASAGDFQYWLKQVENMTLRREAKIQQRVWDIRARRLQQRRARDLSRAGSSSPSRRLPGRVIAYGVRGAQGDEFDRQYVPQNSPVHHLQSGVAGMQPTGYHHRQTHASRASPAVGETQDGFSEMIGTRRLPPPLPSPSDAAFRDRSVPRHLFDSRPSSASSGGSFVAMHQSFKGLTTHSPASLGTHQREQDVSPHRSNKRFAADPDWADNPFTLPPSSQHTHAQQASMHLPLPSGYYSPSNDAPAMPRYRGPRSIPAHEVHQNLHPSSGYYDAGFDGRYTGGRSDDYEKYAQALVAPFTGYEAALTSSREREPASLAYYEVRSGPYRSMQNTGEPAPFMTHHGQDGWETLRQAAQHFPESGPVDVYSHGSYSAPYDGTSQGVYPSSALHVPSHTGVGGVHPTISHQSELCGSDTQSNADFQAAVQDAYAQVPPSYATYAQHSQHHHTQEPMQSHRSYQAPGHDLDYYGASGRGRTESYPYQHQVYQ
ncbi:unnamed protein product [Tilletia controversa]|uniref:Cyclin N-terminal domain-containing protein n=1 Tax=Tilletia controversa TaxID=13291 RepID=A0A8X7MXM2_9BASI|nr:hypothetical protein CF328_g1398 [Tilletia controversa]KAE8252889.1 hypothetical protein A4X06_0g1855 [Tilletia controversa]CAD6915532.1 unnamed protein product [Tilletia controversa]CAD6922156.1 unnamed protein product [Tilletia controversa]CAD6964338.1 unnamed protein product [Tilletia controversa]